MSNINVFWKKKKKENKSQSWAIQRPSEIFHLDCTELCTAEKTYLVIASVPLRYMVFSHTPSLSSSFNPFLSSITLNTLICLFVRIQTRQQLKDISNKKTPLLQTCLSCLLNLLFSSVVPSNSSLGDFRQFIFFPCAEAIENFPLLST